MSSDAPASQPMPTFSLLAAVTAVLAFRVACALRPLDAIDGLAIPDDGYIVLDLARSFATGLGPDYHGIPTNGFQPLIVFLFAPLFWLTPGDPDSAVVGGMILGGAFDALTMALACVLVGLRRLGGCGMVIAAAYWLPHGIRSRCLISPFGARWPRMQFES